MLILWLERADRDLSDLAGWLQGLGLPPVGDAEEPYLWLLRGLPLGGDRARYESELARSAGALLDKQPDVQVGDLPDRLLYNLLLLCAGLRGRDELADPLLRMRERDGLRDRQWMAVPLTDALRSALIVNQADNRLASVWEAMWEGRGDKQLGGTRHDGFQGALYMPPSATERGKPADQAIGRALTHLAASLSNRPDKLTAFRSLLDRVRQRYLAHGWDMEMIRYSDAHEWFEWTDAALPNLYISLNSHHFVLWRPLVKVVQQVDGAGLAHEFCNGRVLEVSIPPSAMGTLHLTAPAVERFRRTTQSLGGRATLGLLSSALAEAAKLADSQQDDVAKGALRRARKAIVTKAIPAFAHD